MMPKLGNLFLSSRTAVGINPFGLKASLPSGAFNEASITGKSARTGIPRSTHSWATLNSKSNETRLMPGIEATASDLPLPSSKKTG